MSRCEAVDDICAGAPKRTGLRWMRCDADSRFAPYVNGVRRRVCWLHYQALSNASRAKPLELVKL